VVFLGKTVGTFGVDFGKNLIIRIKRAKLIPERVELVIGNLRFSVIITVLMIAYVLFKLACPDRFFCRFFPPWITPPAF